MAHEIMLLNMNHLCYKTKNPVICATTGLKLFLKDLHSHYVILLIFNKFIHFFGIIVR